MTTRISLGSIAAEYMNPHELLETFIMFYTGDRSLLKALNSAFVIDVWSHGAGERFEARVPV